jgi:PIN domain nuclease of toxin-antitoxin system
MLVLDTSALLFATINRTSLSSDANYAIEQAPRILISSISIWEIALKIEQKKLILPTPIQTYVSHLKQVDRVELVPVDEMIWMKNVELAWAHKDPADRTIVATATLFDCPIITSDLEIRSFYQRVIW